MTLSEPLDDGVVVLRTPKDVDSDALSDTHDVEAVRFLGSGEGMPRPYACLEVAGEVVGWLDVDQEREWLRPGEVNIGYAIHPQHRGRGYASRGLELFVQHGLSAGHFQVATLLIDPINSASISVATSCGFTHIRDLDGQRFFARPTTIRPKHLDTTYSSVLWSPDGTMVTKVRKSSPDARRRFRYEHRMARLLTSVRPPVPTPKLIDSNVQRRTLVFEAVDGEPLGPKYPDRDVDVRPIVDTARRLGPFEPRRRWFRSIDPTRRLALAVRMGVLPPERADELAPLATKLGRQLRFSHGDLTARNMLIDGSGGAVPIDWEWAGLYPPDYDLGFLWFTLLEVPEQRAEVEASVDDPVPMLLSALLVQVWHLQWYVHEEFNERHLANRDEILRRLCDWRSVASVS